MLQPFFRSQAGAQHDHNTINQEPSLSLSPETVPLIVSPPGPCAGLQASALSDLIPSILCSPPPLPNPILKLSVAAFIGVLLPFHIPLRRWGTRSVFVYLSSQHSLPSPSSWIATDTFISALIRCVSCHCFCLCLSLQYSTVRYLAFLSIISFSYLTFDQPQNISFSTHANHIDLRDLVMTLAALAGPSRMPVPHISVNVPESPAFDDMEFPSVTQLPDVQTSKPRSPILGRHPYAASNGSQVDYTGYPRASPFSHGSSARDGLGLDFPFLSNYTSSFSSPGLKSTSQFEDRDQRSDSRLWPRGSAIFWDNASPTINDKDNSLSLLPGSATLPYSQSYESDLGTAFPHFPSPPARSSTGSSSSVTSQSNSTQVLSSTTSHSVSQFGTEAAPKPLLLALSLSSSATGRPQPSQAPTTGPDGRAHGIDVGNRSASAAKRTSRLLYLKDGRPIGSPAHRDQYESTSGSVSARTSSSSAEFAGPQLTFTRLAKPSSPVKDRPPTHVHKPQPVRPSRGPGLIDLSHLAERYNGSHEVSTMKPPLPSALMQARAEQYASKATSARQGRAPSYFASPDSPMSFGSQTSLSSTPVTPPSLLPSSYRSSRELTFPTQKRMSDDVKSKGGLISRRRTQSAHQPSRPVRDPEAMMFALDLQKRATQAQTEQPVPIKAKRPTMKRSKSSTFRNVGQSLKNLAKGMRKQDADDADNSGDESGVWGPTVRHPTPSPLEGLQQIPPITASSSSVVVDELMGAVQAGLEQALLMTSPASSSPQDHPRQRSTRGTVHRDYDDSYSRLALKRGHLGLVEHVDHLDYSSIAMGVTETEPVEYRPIHYHHARPMDKLSSPVRR